LFFHATIPSRFRFRGTATTWDQNKERATPLIGLVLVVETLLELPNRSIGRADGRDAMSAEVIRGTLHVFLGASQWCHGFADLRVRLGPLRP
jgi:hypothetical protein